MYSHINDYALIGLRTLAVAVRRLSQEEYSAFSSRLSEAREALTDRESRVRAAYSEVESDLELIGAVAVEDRLQEDVTGTLVRLGMAGVKVWVLTGDKKETAVNISYSCGHFQRGMQVVDLAGQDANTVGNAMEAGVRKMEAEPNEK